MGASRPEHRARDVIGAKECARRVIDEAREQGVVPDTVKETWIQWFARFHAGKEAQGPSSVAEMRGRFAK